MDSEQKIAKLGRRVKTVEEAVLLLTELTTIHDEKSYTHMKNGEELNAKISAMIDAQIRSEDKIQTINQALDKLIDLTRLAHQRLDKLEK